MIVGGDWLITGADVPIRGGAVLVHASRVAEVGTFAALTALHPSTQSEYFRGCIVTPGLVNAHTHLSLSVLKGLIPSGPMPEWLKRVTAAIRVMGPDDLAASAALGALECLQCGVTVVGDIAYGPEALATAADAGVGGTFYWEVLGISADDLSGELAEREFPTTRGACVSARSRCGISPHSPYTSGPRLIEAVAAVSRAHGTPFAIHVAEAAAERTLLTQGTGAFAPVAHRLAPDLRTPHRSPVGYLDSLGALENALAIHCVDVDAADIRLLKAKAAGVVVCPRSNAYLHNGAPPVAALYHAGLTLAIGTDSLASNGDLDLLAEAREVRRLGATITSRRLLRMITADGAKALSMSDTLGSLEAGKQADLAVFRHPSTSDPETALVTQCGRDSVEAVFSGGAWRVRDGRPCFPTAGVERAAERVRTRVRRALA